jgi:hypothetical protein
MRESSSVSETVATDDYRDNLRVLMANARLPAAIEHVIQPDYRQNDHKQAKTSWVRRYSKWYKALQASNKPTMAEASKAAPIFFRDHGHGYHDGCSHGYGGDVCLMVIMVTVMITSIGLPTFIKDS